MIDVYESDEDMAKQIAQTAKKRKKQDMKELLRCIMDMPSMSSEETVHTIEEGFSARELSHMNTTMGTRIALTMAIEAGNGDPKFADLFLRYAGFAPAIEQEISVKLPTFVDDISSKIIDVTPAPPKLEAPEDDEEAKRKARSEAIPNFLKAPKTKDGTPRVYPGKMDVGSGKKTVRYASLNDGCEHIFEGAKGPNIILRGQPGPGMVALHTPKGVIYMEGGESTKPAPKVKSI